MVSKEIKYEVSSNLPSNARNIFGQMLDCWLTDACQHEHYLKGGSNNTFSIKFSSYDDMIYIRLVGMPDHLNKYIRIKNSARNF